MVSIPTSRPVTVPVSNPALVATSPLGILGGDNVGLWLSADFIVPGSGSEITTMIDQSDTGADPTESTASKRPNIITVNGKKYADFVRASSQELSVTSLSTPIVPDGTATMTAWWTGQWDTFSLTMMMFDIQNTALGADSCMAIRSFASTPGFLIRVYAGGGPVTFITSTFTDTAIGVYELRWDGATVELFFNDVSVDSIAKTGTTIAGDSIFLGTSVSANFLDGSFRELVVHRGATAPTAAERTAMFAYMNGNK